MQIDILSNADSYGREILASDPPSLSWTAGLIVKKGAFPKALKENGAV